MWAMLALAGIQAGAQIYQGYQAKEAADANAALLREQADYQKRLSSEQASQFAKQGESFIGSQRAGIAASGVKMEGSPLLAMKESEANLRRDVSNIRQGGTVAHQAG